LDLRRRRSFPSMKYSGRSEDQNSVKSTSVVRELPLRLRFAYESQSWGGGTVFGEDRPSAGYRCLVDRFLRHGVRPPVAVKCDYFPLQRRCKTSLYTAVQACPRESAPRELRRNDAMSG
jgi:hypothetical protein